MAAIEMGKSQRSVSFVGLDYRSFCPKRFHNTVHGTSSEPLVSVKRGLECLAC